jgi:hypothetical protein
MTVKVTVCWYQIKETKFDSQQEAFSYAQTMREAGFKVEVR